MTIGRESQKQINSKNQDFWNELCGTSLAKHLGIVDFSKQSLKKFDRWYFDMYPYLKKHVRSIDIKNKTVLEIGLGYGTLSQYLAENVENYFGVDIAKGPVDMVNRRLEYMAKSQSASIQSCHNLQFEDQYFDAVVSIGCFHHTGSVERCVQEAFRVLKKGGYLLFMCYNKNSMRMLKKFPFQVFFNKQDPVTLNETASALYGANSDGDAAPFIELASKKYYYSICSKFSKVDITCENWEGEHRKLFLNNIAHILGLDLYVVCKK